VAKRRPRVRCAASRIRRCLVVRVLRAARADRLLPVLFEYTPWRHRSQTAENAQSDAFARDARQASARSAAPWRQVGGGVVGGGAGVVPTPGVQVHSVACATSMRGGRELLRVNLKRRLECWRCG